MKANRTKTRAFTLIELLTVLVVISILGCLLLPAMAHTRNRSYDAGCLSGLRQMMVGWALYKDENSDILVLNAPGGDIGWCQRSEGWSAVDGNTNSAIYYNSVLAPYINNHIESYRCPADVIPSDNGTRLRSRSMNGQVGTLEGALRDNPNWRTYLKVTDLTCPQPKDMFIFADESMYSLNDGYLQMDLNAPDYPEVPANYHDGGCGISFADGRAEIHKWQWTASSTLGLVNVPYLYGVNNKTAHWPSSASDVDWVWLRAHSACHR